MLTIPTKKETRKPHPRVNFTEAEDAKLIELVNQFGDVEWMKIADNMPGRNIRQCRERWLNYLSPDLDKGPWTREEDNLLLQKYQEIGPKWKAISTLFPKRTDISLKNRMHKLVRSYNKKNALISSYLEQSKQKTQKKVAKKQDTSIEQKTFTPCYQPIMQKQPQPQPPQQQEQQKYVDSFLEDEQDVFAVNFENGFGCEFQDFAF